MNIKQKLSNKKLHKKLQLNTALIAILAISLTPAFAGSLAAKGQTTTGKISSITLDGINFGDDGSQWSNDGECDDPRFIGEGTAVDMEDTDILHDATDCSTLYQSGDVSLKPAPGDIVSTINFGDNSSEWANNNICDDPRFGGEGTDELLLDEDMNHDSVDCKALFLSGAIQYLGDDINMQTVEFDGISFGDNTSEWKSDGECDDPRFRGAGMATQLVDADLGHDAQDCLALYKDGSITLSGDATPIPTGTIDFGDDSSQWANDNECDDPRFAGEGVSGILLDSDLGRDASDCSALFDAGKIYLAGSNGETTNNALDFGDDDGRWAGDGECDDPRFIGEGMATQLSAEDIGHDASDCQSLVQSGNIALITAANLDFGDDESQWPNDGECDDPRFAGDGTASKLDPKNLGHDATDCRALLDSGAVQFVGGILSIVDPVQVMNATPIPDNSPASLINWGDDSSQWSNDGECDDPRFSGPGSAQQLVDADRERDATDCRTLFEAGEIQLSAGNALRGFHNTGFDFGDNTSEYANNQTCDDPRFTGPGTDGILLAEDEGRDANDCKALFRVGQVSLASDLSLDFGRDTSQWANDGECDDPRFAGKSMAADLDDVNILQDATDCRGSFELGRIYLIADGKIDFGDDSSDWANDNECDDPRFAGPGVASGAVDENILKDASDCRAQYRAANAYLLGAQGSAAAINFGDNTSTWASDGECDDPRFFGPGSADELVDEDLGHDAVDCRALLDAGQIQFGATPEFGKPKGGETPSTSAIDFGDDSSQWSNDGECDDPRFAGQGVASTLLDSDLGRDATDCRSLFDDGIIEYIGGETSTATSSSIIHQGIDFGDNSSDYANNQICDDLRFGGQGVDDVLLPEDEGHDATDCLNHFMAGTVTLAQTSIPSAPTPGGIDFGDDSSSWANDNECDDPRFEGEGVSGVLLDDDLGRDASDCSALFSQGKIQLIGDAPSVPAQTGAIDFGDNTSTWANDNRCDDPRFEGEGTSPPLLPEDEGRDADDCAALFGQGKVQLIGQADTAMDTAAMDTPIDPDNIDFGDNISLFADDNECDDPRFTGAGMAPAPQFAGDLGHDANDCQALFDDGEISLAQ